MPNVNFEELPIREQERVRNLGEQLSRVPMNYATPIYFGPPPNQAENHNINNGTGSLVSINDSKYCITNHHVLEAYNMRLENGEELVFHAGNVSFDPEEKLVSESQQYDLAIFDFSDFSEADIGTHGEVPTQYFNAISWPPEIPSSQSFVMFGGYPGYWRQLLQPNEILFDTLSSGGTEVIASNEERLICQLQLENCLTHRVQPERDGPGNLSGLSGGPVLIERRSECGISTFEFVGVIYEYGENLDCLNIRPASLISENGNIIAPNP